MPQAWDAGEIANQRRWDELAPVHAESYEEIQLLRDGGISLDEIELADLGAVSDKTLLHLQCHLGTDTLSWARRGAQVTGVDFSRRSIDYARQLQAELGLRATFIAANVYDLPDVLDERFDIVYTSRGVLCWLKDLPQWGRLIARYLRPGGIFYLLESHPICNIFEDTQPGPLKIAHPYFHTPEPTIWDDDTPDYADSAYIPRNPSHEWTWSLSDVLNALLQAGLHLEAMHEYDHLFDRRFPDMVPCGNRSYRLAQYAGKLPLLFTIKARLPKASAR